jgi:hypothetical protein
MRIGDHIKLGDRAAGMMAKRRNWRSKSKVNWFSRTGTVKIISSRGNSKTDAVGNDLVGVQWDGRSSLDWWKANMLVVIDEVPPPA